MTNACFLRAISFLALFTLTNSSLALQSNAEIKTRALAAHNKFRALHHAPNLVWDETLASYAAEHANKCVFRHSSSPYGENLAAGHKTITAAVTAWYDENKKYSYDHPGFSMQTGHFTQVVWKASQKLGCAVADCNGRNGTPGYFWVCEYSPHGNVTNRGRFEANVLRAN